MKILGLSRQKAGETAEALTRLRELYFPPGKPVPAHLYLDWLHIRDLLDALRDAGQAPVKKTDGGVVFSDYEGSD